MCTHIHGSAVCTAQESEILLSITTRMDLEGIMLSKLSQTEKDYTIRHHLHRRVVTSGEGRQEGQ